MDDELVVINAIEELGLCSAFRDVPNDIDPPYAVVTSMANPYRISTVCDPSVEIGFYGRNWKEARTLGIDAADKLISQLLLNKNVFNASIDNRYRSDDTQTNIPRSIVDVSFTLVKSNIKDDKEK